MKKFDVCKFDGAYIMFSSILHLHSKKDLISHFKSVNKNLKKGGLYIIDLSSLPFNSPFKPAIFKKKKGNTERPLKTRTEKKWKRPMKTKTGK